MALNPRIRHTNTNLLIFMVHLKPWSDAGYASPLPAFDNMDSLTTALAVHFTNKNSIDGHDSTTTQRPADDDCTTAFERLGLRK